MGPSDANGTRETKTRNAKICKNEYEETKKHGKEMQNKNKEAQLDVKYLQRDVKTNASLLFCVFSVGPLTCL